MQADLHYYTTYIAALAAGWNASEAAEIAMAAHYVDCSGDPGVIPSPFPEHRQNKEPLQSTIGPVRMLYKAISSTDDLATRKIWAAFHFMPANNNDPSVKFQYAWDSVDRAPPQDAKPRETLQKVNPVAYRRPGAGSPPPGASWRCFPYSDIVEEMKDDTIIFLWQAHYSKDPQQLMLARAILGVRLHVLADTFSHAGFSAPKTLANNFDWMEIKHQGNKWLNLLFELMTHAPVNTIGHGYYGALPDFPGIIWRTGNAGFSREIIYRNNPVVFANGVAEIYRWLVEARRELQFGYLNPGAKEILDGLDFGSAEFAYPGSACPLGSFPLPVPIPSNIDKQPLAGQYNFKGQAESDAYLERRCEYLYNLIGRGLHQNQELIPRPIHEKETEDLKTFEKNKGLGRARTASWYDTSLPSWSDVTDCAAEYRIVRWVRYHYFREDANDSYDKLRAVNEAAKYHLQWFDRYIYPKLPRVE